MQVSDEIKESNQELFVCFDVDGTLITLNGDKPRYEVIQLLLTLKALGCRIYVWSGGGIDYAQQHVNRLGLAPLVRVIQKGKEGFQADITFDDMELAGRAAERALGKVNIRV